MNKHLIKSYSCKNKNEIVDCYDKWSGTYHDDIQNLGYRAPDACINMAIKYVKKNSSIIDLGCGTGLVGEKLKKAGFMNIDGLDCNEKMIEISKKKLIYNNMFYSFLEDFTPRKKYDAAIAVGIFTPGHASVDGMVNMFNYINTGGIAIFSCTEPALKSGFENKINELIRLKKIKEVERRYYNSILKNAPEGHNFPFYSLAFKKI